MEHQNTTLSSDEGRKHSAPKYDLPESPNGHHLSEEQSPGAREESSALSNAVHSKTVTRSEAKIVLLAADHFTVGNFLDVSPVEVDHLQVERGTGVSVRAASYNKLF